MEKVFARAEELADMVRQYVELRIKSAKLSSAEIGSEMIATLTTKFILVLVFFCFILFASLALALVLGTWIGTSWAGFLIIASIYLLTGLVLSFLKIPLILTPTQDAAVQQLLTDDEAED